MCPVSSSLTVPSSIISCSYSSANQPRNGILFYKTNDIQIENLTIEYCGAMFTIYRPDNFTLVSALTFHESYDINLTQVRIDSSLGFGLDANQVFGLFRVSKSIFVRCKAYRLEKNKNIGGNARFGYSCYNTSTGVVIQNTTLTIDHSWFMYGRLSYDIRYFYASGLIIHIYIPSVHVCIHKMTAKHNVGYHGGNVAIHITDIHENTSTVAISNSLIVNGSAIRGGGLQFWAKTQFERHNTHNMVNTTNRLIINITNTVFANNSAGESGGGVYIGHYETETIDTTVRHISFVNCTFSQNSINYKAGLTRSYSGAAIQIIRHNIDAFVPHNVPQYSMDFCECNFEKNTMEDVINEGGILDFVSTKNVIITNCSFTFNNGCLLYTSPSPRDATLSRMPSSA